MLRNALSNVKDLFEYTDNGHNMVAVRKKTRMINKENKENKEN